MQQKTGKQQKQQETQLSLAQQEKEQRKRELKDFQDKRVLSMDEQVKKQQISSVEERALNKVFQHICNAKEYYKFDENNSRHQSDDEEKKKQMEEKKRSTMRMQKPKNQSIMMRPVTEQHFTCQDLMLVLNELEYSPSKDTVNEMIWDIDEDNTGCITKGKFELMYKRCRFDETNMEPRSIYNVVQYLMFLYNSSANRPEDQELEIKQKDNKIYITFENTLEILYVIYGRELMKKYTKLLFGEDEGSGYNSGINEVQISLEQYLKIMRQHDIDARTKDKKEKKEKYQKPPPPVSDFDL